MRILLGPDVDYGRVDALVRGRDGQGEVSGELDYEQAKALHRHLGQLLESIEEAAEKRGVDPSELGDGP